MKPSIPLALGVLVAAGLGGGPAAAGLEAAILGHAGQQVVDGERLERDFWAAMKAGNMAEIEARIAPGFQSVHQDGARDREAQIELIKGLNLGDYTLSDFQVSRNEGFIVVTYSVAVTETIDSEVLPTASAARMSVWAETDAGWQWIAHANLNPLRPSNR